MGVPRRENADIGRSILNGETQDYRNYDLSESADEITEISRRISVEQLHPIRSKAAKKMKMGGAKSRNFDDFDTDGVQVKRNMGMRKWRRVEHARILMSFTDLDDICEDGSDIATPPTTAFDKLFSDKENMRLWNEFCSCDEVEQRRILNGTSKLQKTPDTPTTSTGKSSEVVTSCSGKSPTKKAPRRISPYSASACFDRIDLKSRMMLLGRKVNWAFVDFLEKELRTVFQIDARNQQDTEAIFIGHYPASTDRLLAHIVAQWLGLSSQSITDPNLKERVTEFRNRRPLIPPQVTLIHFMESRILKKELEFIPFSMRDEDEQKEKNEASEENQDNVETEDQMEKKDLEVEKEPVEAEEKEREDSEESDTSFVVADELDALNIAGGLSDNEEGWEKVSKPTEDL